MFHEPEFIELLSCEEKEYLVKTIYPNVFRAQFRAMTDEDLRKSHQIFNDFEQLSTFWIDSKLNEFSSLFEEINEKCLYTFEFKDEDGAMPEHEFRDPVEKIFSQIQKYCDQ